MTIKEIDHSEKAVGRVTDELSKENFEKFVEVFTESSQEIEVAFQDIAVQKDIDTASGIWLDYLGKLLGVTRKSQTDEEYRVSLKVQVAINTSDGTPSVIQETVKLFTNATSVRYREISRIFPGFSTTFNLFVDFEMNGREELYDLVQKIKPVGTQAIIHTDYRNEGLTSLDLIWEADYDQNPYPPSVNVNPEINRFAWELELTSFNAESGEPLMEAGEPSAQAGESGLSIVTDFERPLRWEAYRPPVVQQDNSSLFCDINKGYFYNTSYNDNNIWLDNLNFNWNSEENYYETVATVPVMPFEIWIGVWQINFGIGFQPTQLQIALSTAEVVDGGDFPFTSTIEVLCDNADEVIGTTVVNVTSAQDEYLVFVDLDWSAQENVANLKRIEFTNSVTTEFPRIICLSLTG